MRKKLRVMLLYEPGAQIPLGQANLKVSADADPRLRGLVSVELIGLEAAGGLGALPGQAPDLVGFYAGGPNPQCCCDLGWLSAAAGALKRKKPGLRILIAGPTTSFIGAAELFERGAADYILRGEAEESFPELLLALARGTGLAKVPGLLRNTAPLRAQSGPASLPDLARLPSPYLSGLFDPVLKDHSQFWIEGSRGCRRSCGYCTMCVAGPTRFFPTDRVLGEIAYVAARAAGRLTFSLSDNDLFEDKARAGRLLRGFLALAGPGRDIHLALAGNLHSLNAKLLRLLNSPRFNVGFGIQSTDPGTQALCGRSFDAGKLDAYIRDFRRLAPRAMFSLDLIKGLPGDTYASFAHTLDWAVSSGARDIRVNTLLVLPNTGFGAGRARLRLKARPRYPYEVLAAGTFTAADLRRADALTAKVAPLLLLAADDNFLAELIRGLGGRLRGKTELPYLAVCEKLADHIRAEKLTVHRASAADHASQRYRIRSAGPLLAFARQLLEAHGLGAAFAGLKRSLPEAGPAGARGRR